MNSREMTLQIMQCLRDGRFNMVVLNLLEPHDSLSPLSIIEETLEY